MYSLQNKKMEQWESDYKVIVKPKSKNCTVGGNINLSLWITEWRLLKMKTYLSFDHFTTSD